MAFALLPGSGFSKGDWALTAWLGESTDPTTTVVSAVANYDLNDEISVGPLLQYGFEADLAFLAPSFLVKRHFRLRKSDELRAYVQGGVGIIYFLDDDTGGAPTVGEDELGFLVNIGGGIDYEFHDGVLLGPR